MEIGPLEYVVLGFENGQFASIVLPELKDIGQSGLIRVVDLLFVSKATDGTVSLQEVSELGEEDQAAYEELADGLTGLLTAEDVERLAQELPAGTWAVIVVFEHRWTLQLAESVRSAGGVLFTGGMVASEALAQVSAELAAAKEDSHA
jgi:Family of unknown function (DUF6325)